MVCLAQSAAAMDSASLVQGATIDWRSEGQETAPVPMVITKPDTDQQVLWRCKKSELHHTEGVRDVAE